jgi:hypothetical protein
MAVAAQWERCSQLCHFADLSLSTLPNAHQVFEIIGEIRTLIVLVQELCTEREL